MKFSGVIFSAVVLLLLSDTAQCKRDCKSECCAFVEGFPARLKELRSSYKQILKFYVSTFWLMSSLDIAERHQVLALQMPIAVVMFLSNAFFSSFGPGVQWRPRSVIRRQCAKEHQCKWSRIYSHALNRQLSDIKWVRKQQKHHTETEGCSNVCEPN